MKNISSVGNSKLNTPDLGQLARGENNEALLEKVLLLLNEVDSLKGSWASVCLTATRSAPGTITVTC